MKLARTLFAACVFVIAAAAEGQARCVCRCVDGEVQPVCSSPADLPPLCRPMVCIAEDVPPEPPPSLKVPPPGAKSCRQVRVCDDTNLCDWEEVCR